MTNYSKLFDLVDRLLAAEKYAESQDDFMYLSLYLSRLRESLREVCEVCGLSVAAVTDATRDFLTDGKFPGNWGETGPTDFAARIREFTA